MPVVGHEGTGGSVVLEDRPVPFQGHGRTGEPQTTGLRVPRPRALQATETQVGCMI